MKRLLARGFTLSLFAALLVLPAIGQDKELGGRKGTTPVRTTPQGVTPSSRGYAPSYNNPPPQAASEIESSPEPTIDFGGNINQYSKTAGKSLDLVVAKCGGKVQFGGGGGDGDSSKNQDCSPLPMDKGFAKHMDKYLLKCVQLAAAHAGFGTVARMHVHHMGCFADRQMNTMSGPQGVSLHAHARALDISGFSLYPPGGGSPRFVSANKKEADKHPDILFYREFRRCWAYSLKKATGGACGSDGRGMGSIGFEGSGTEVDGNMLYDNSKHNDHIHLEYPMCAGSGGEDLIS